MRCLAVLGLVAASTLSSGAVLTTAQEKSPPAKPTPDQPAASADKEARPLTILDDPPAKLVPSNPRTVDDIDHLEALSLFAAGRLHEQRQDFSEALKLYERALRTLGQP